MTVLHHSVPILECRAMPQGLVQGYASVFGGVDAYGDTVVPGAYAATLARHRAKGTVPKQLWSHKTDRPIGRWERLEEDSRGLVVHGRLNLKTDAGNEAFEHLRAGDLNGLSIGFTIPAGGSEERSGIRLLKAIELHEVSIVAFPADDAARVTAVKAAAERPATLRDFEAALRSLGFTRKEAERIAAKGFGQAGDDEPEDDGPALEDLRAVKAALLTLSTSLCLKG